MKINDILLKKNKRNKRLGRGQGSGKGGTSSRGHKGYKSRSGSHKKYGFEGGQMPLQRRVPKIGFNSIRNKIRKKHFSIINLDTINLLLENNEIKNNVIDKNVFLVNGLVQKRDFIKILGRGNKLVKENLKIFAHAFSQTAIKIIHNSKGECVKIK